MTARKPLVSVGGQTKELPSGDSIANTDISGLGSASTSASSDFQPSALNLTTWAGLTPSVNAQSLVTAADYSAMRTLLSLNNVTNVAQLPLSYLDTDGALAANSDVKVPSQKAVKTAIDALIGANDVETYKGVIDCSANPNYPAADAGHVYRVSIAGKIGGASGTNVEIGDRLQCITDGSASGTQASVGANWWVTQTNIDGAVVGPASATDGGFVKFDGTTGKLIKNSAATVAPSDVLLSATDRLVGRSSSGGGAGEEITCTSAGRALIDDADAAAQRTTLALGTIATQAIAALTASLIPNVDGTIALGSTSKRYNLVSSTNFADGTDSFATSSGAAAIIAGGTSWTTVVIRCAGNDLITMNSGEVRLTGTPTVISTDSAGFRGAPQQTGLATASYTLVLADAGKHVYHTSASAHTLTIPANGSVAFPIGTIIIAVNANGAGVLTVAITTDTLHRGDGTAGTGSRTVAADSIVTLIKVTATDWYISGKFT